jgi:hypothetical protein
VCISGKREMVFCRGRSSFGYVDLESLIVESLDQSRMISESNQVVVKTMLESELYES